MAPLLIGPEADERARPSAARAQRTVRVNRMLSVVS